MRFCVCSGASCRVPGGGGTLNVEVIGMLV